jgi:hypothetical protein
MSEIGGDALKEMPLLTNKAVVVPKGRTSSRYLSVWNVVPTLTSSKHQGLSLDGRC